MKNIQVISQGIVIMKVNKPKSAKWKLEELMLVYANSKGESYSSKRVPKGHIHIGRISKVINDGLCKVSL